MNLQTFFNEIRPMFYPLTAEQVKGVEGIINAFNEVGDGDQDTLAYALATAYYESPMIPVREGFAKTDEGARRAVEALARRRGPKSAVARYSKPAGPYGHVYYGRGFPQLTWLDNYEKSSKDAGVDLVKNPDAMLDPKISARILIKGIMDGRWNGRGKGIDFYEGEDEFLDDKEAAEARRTVNVQDKAVQIAGYHRRFYNALTKAGFGAIQQKAPQATEGWFRKLLRLLFGGMK